MRALIVDGQPLMGRMLVEGLCEVGWDASATTGVGEAIALLQSGRYSVVVCDVDRDGFDLLLRAGSNVPVILMSSFGDAQTSRQALEAGAFAYLPKPFELNELLSLLERAHGRPLPTV